MAQQTAMKQMIDYLDEMKSKTIDQSEIYMLTYIWVKAIHLMEVEKEQFGYSKEDVLKAGEIGEINHLDTKHIISYLDEAKEINNKK